MNGAVATTFLIVFREALEASLVVGIIMTVLARLKQSRFFPLVIGSSLLAMLASFFIGLGLMMLTGKLRGSAEEMLEGVVALVACGVLTYMVFWMDTQARKIKPEIETKVEQAVSRGEVIAIITLPFLAVIREGAETVLFLKAVASKNSLWVSLAGGASGLLLAVLVVCLIFIGGKRFPLKPLFRVSGICLLLMAAGLLAQGIHAFQELKMLPTLIPHVWDLNSVLNEKHGFGALLKSLFGYNGNPSLLELTAYFFYLAAISHFLLRQKNSPAV